MPARAALKPRKQPLQARSRQTVAAILTAAAQVFERRGYAGGTTDAIAERPVMIGHEFCGELVAVGAKWKDKFKEGERFSIQPALFYEGGPLGILSAPGYTYENIGGDATHVIIPREVMEQDCLLPYDGEAYFMGSLAEPVSCIAGAFHAQYHTTQGSYEHRMGIVEGGAVAILAGVGPMGLGAIDYAIHADLKPRLLVVTDIDQDRLDRAASIYSVGHAAEHGVDLRYVNTKDAADPVAAILEWLSLCLLFVAAAIGVGKFLRKVQAWWVIPAGP